MAIQKSDSDAIHARKRQDFEESISGGTHLARFEANLGTLVTGLTTIIIILLITIYAYFDSGSDVSRSTLIVAVSSTGLIGAVFIFLIKRRVRTWLGELRADTFNARRKADEDYSTQV